MSIEEHNRERNRVIGGLPGTASDSRYQCVSPRSLHGSLIFDCQNISCREVREVDLDPSNWTSGARFFPKKFIFAGSPDMWILAKTTILGERLSGVDIPCDTYGPGTDHTVNWPPFSVHYETKLFVENRGNGAKGDFIARIAGEYDR